MLFSTGEKTWSHMKSFLSYDHSSLSATIGKSAPVSTTKILSSDTYLRLLTSLGSFLKTGSDTFRSVLIYGKEQESQKEKFHNNAKISSF